MTHLSFYSLNYRRRGALFMFELLKKCAAIICLFVQVVIVIMYGFTGVHISQYVCLGIWVVCGALGVCLISGKHVI